MRISLAPLQILCLLAFLSGRAPAQQPGEISPVLGYEFGVPHSIDRQLDVVNRLGTAGPGVAYNHSLRAGAELELPAPSFPRLGAVARLELTGSTGAFRSDPLRSAAGFPSGRRAILRELEVEVRSLAVSGELRLELRPGGAWRPALGAWGSYRVASGYVESERALSPGDTLPGGVTSRIIARGDSLGSGPFRYGPILALRSAIRLSATLTIAPEIRARLDLPSIGLGIRAVDLGVGLALRFGDASRDGAPDVVPAVASELPVDRLPEGTRPPEAARPRLSASIDLRAVEPDGTVQDQGSIAMEWERRRITLELPAFVALPVDPAWWRAPAGLSADSEELRALFDPSETPASASSSTGSSLARVLPDLLGARMRLDTALRVVLRGTASELDDARRGLAARWGVDVGRIAPAPVAGSRVDRIAVAPAAGSERLFAAIEEEWTVRRFRVPRLDLSPEITSEAGVRHWSVMVRHAGREVARSSSDGASPLPALSVRIPGAPDDTVIAPFVAELTAEDSTGATVTVRDTLPLRVEGEPAIAPDRARLVWTMLAVDEAGPVDTSLPERALEAVMARATGAVADGDVVRIDLRRTGDDAASVRARRLVERLRAALRRRGVVPVIPDVREGDAGGIPAGGIAIVITRRSEAERE